MKGISLLLGPVEFRDFELPPRINIGGAQRVVVHQLLDGTRVIDALGRNDDDISFAGTFTGAGATLRARVLDEMRVSGSVYTLTWDVFIYSVVIKRFIADYRNGWWIPYKITCAIVMDEASVAVDRVASPGEAIRGDLGSANELGSLTGADMSAIAAASSTSYALSEGTSAVTALSQTVSQTIIALDDSIACAETDVSSAAAVTDTSSSAIVAVTLVDSVVGMCGQLAASVTARAYLARACTNLANLGT